ncbi:MAG: hypothetical protein WAQ52_09670 [Terriglobales bacterium]
MDRESHWQPRGGRKLNEELPESWLERTTISVLGRIPKIFLYGPVALVLATALTTDLQWRSYAWLAIAIWLSVDLWNWLLGKTWRWKFVVGWITTNLLLIGAMSISWIIMSALLLDIRKQTYEQLSTTISIPYGVDDPVDSTITISNGPRSNIIEIKASCQFRDLQYANAMSFEFSKSEVAIPLDSSSLEAGDSESGMCLWNQLVAVRAPVRCADLFITVEYRLQDQPLIPQLKPWRFITRKRGDRFTWTPEPTNLPHSLCGTLDGRPPWNK